MTSLSEFQGIQLDLCGLSSHANIAQNKTWPKLCPQEHVKAMPKTELQHVAEAAAARALLLWFALNQTTAFGLEQRIGKSVISGWGCSTVGRKLT